MVSLTRDLMNRLRRQLIPATPAPCVPAGGIDVQALRAYVDWMQAFGLKAVAVNAHTGRGLHLTEDDRTRVIETWRTGAPNLRVVSGAGVPTNTTLPPDPSARTRLVVVETVRMGESAVAAGASALLVYPPTALRGLSDLDERVIDLYEALADLGVPIVAFYLYEEAGGVPFTYETIDRLLAMEHVLGIKVATLDSVMTFQDVASVVAGHPDKLLITGEDRFLGYSLTVGAASALVGIGAACTDVIKQLLDTWFERDLERFHALSFGVDCFAKVTFTTPLDGYVQRMLWALEADGVLSEPIDPFGPVLDVALRDEVRAGVRLLRDS